MVQKTGKRSFGDLLRFFRGQTVDRRTGKSLSQERLAYVLTEKSGLAITRNRVNYWETGKAYLHPQFDRLLLNAIITVLYKHGGIKTLGDANNLLETGNYRTLDNEEITAIAPEWVATVQGGTTGLGAGIFSTSPPAVDRDSSGAPSSGIEAQALSLADTGTRPGIGSSLANSLVQVFFALLEKSPEWLVGGLLNRSSSKEKQKTEKDVLLIDPDCGNQAIDLKQQRLKITAAFGSYFTGLLEKDYSYFPVKGQLELAFQPNFPDLDPFQRIYWSMQYARGPEVFLIAAEGGMGKSTLAAKIIRCLYHDNAVDLLLGDSAKKQVADSISGMVSQVVPGYYDVNSFLKKVSEQLGLNYDLDGSSQQHAISRIKDRLEGRRAVIVLDNLESVQSGKELLDTLRSLSSRDIRILATTRSVSGIIQQASGVFLIRLRPIQDVISARDFLRWHIHRYAPVHPGLQKLEPDLQEKENLFLIIKETGGIPLLMQLALSDIARLSWARLEKLPNLFGIDLLNFLYQEHWDELSSLGSLGKNAIALLFYVRKRTFHGKISYENLLGWSKDNCGGAPIEPILNTLQERFLILNNDLKSGNFSIFPSLSDFLSNRQAP